MEMDYESIFKDFIETEKINGAYHFNISDLNAEMDMYKKRIDTLETSEYSYNNSHQSVDKLLDKYNEALICLRELRDTYNDYTFKDWCIMYDLLVDIQENSDTDNIIG